MLGMHEAMAEAAAAAGAAVPHRLSLDTCQGNTTTVKHHIVYRATGTSIRSGTGLRKSEVKTIGVINCNMSCVREEVSIPVWHNEMCVIGS